MNIILNSALAQALAMSLFHFLWQGALIAAVAAVALKFAARAQTRYAIACSALIAMPVVFAITLRLSIPSEPIASGRSSISMARPSVIPPLDTAPVTRDFSAYLEYAVPLWLAGVLCVLVYRSAAWIWATRLRRRGTCEVPEAWMDRLKLLARRARVWQPVVLLESCLAEVPVVIGYLRPAILIPAGMLTGLPAAHVEAILLHELAHVRRADYLVALMQSAIEGLLFYHPAVWWISGVLRAERENCCDDFAVAIQGDPHAYATALAAIEAVRWQSSPPVLASNDGDLLRRIRRVLRASDARDFTLPLLPAGMLLIAAGIAIADQAPQLVPLPFKISSPQAPALKPPILIAQAQAQTAPQSTEMSPAYRKWLNEEVPYIITDVEREGFKKLLTDQDRAAFVADFWLFRDPTPGTPENEFRDEHYRRIAYANSRFAADIPGWKTDRGRTYIMYGPPDEIDSHPSGGAYQRPAEEGGGSTTTVPFEQWRYKFIEDIGNNIVIEFVDTARTGDYHMTIDPHEKEGTVSGETMLQQMGLDGAKASTNLPGGHIYVDQSVPGPVVALAIPLGFANPVNVVGRVRTSTGQPVTFFEEAVPAGAGPTYFKSVTLKSGSYVFNVIVKDSKTGATYVDSVTFDVK
jgi:GWxTD domain-containing protein